MKESAQNFAHEKSLYRRVRRSRKSCQGFVSPVVSFVFPPDGHGILFSFEKIAFSRGNSREKELRTSLLIKTNLFPCHPAVPLPSFPLSLPPLPPPFPHRTKLTTTP